jgi:CheY-like chemotaxis protein
MPFQSPRFDGQTVLVIEDNIDSREMLGQMLDALGLRAVLAEDAAGALDVLARESPHLILCDLRLPAIDGFELVHRLRADPRLAHMPILAVTALGSAEDYQRTWEAGFHGHVVKPVEFDGLAELLGRHLSRRLSSRGRPPRAAGVSSPPR